MPQNLNHPSTSQSATDKQLQIEAALNTGQIQSALRLLNQSSPHRFTGLFCWEGSAFRSAYLFDREQQEAGSTEMYVPFDESYCSFVSKTQKTFIVLDSLTDPRLEGHPARADFRSYAAVPIFNEDGSFWGTLCYFDAHDNQVSPTQIEILERVGLLLKGSPYLPAA